MPPRFAIIGFGEAGSNIAKTLRDVGVDDIATYDILLDGPGARAAMLEKAEALGAAPRDTLSDAIADADIVFSTVVCKASLPVAQEAAKHLRPEQFYVDFNSISPGLKRQVADAITASGARFVEASVMGGFPGTGHRAPTLLGGAGARDYMALVAPLDFKVDFVQDEVGLASAIKMVRSIMMKGMESLYLECMRAANHFGIEQRVLDTIDKSTAGRTWTDGANLTMPRTAVHAGRRADEMAQVALTLQEIGMDPTMAQATEKNLRWCAGLGLKEIYKDRQAEGYADVLEKIQAASGKS